MSSGLSNLVVLIKGGGEVGSAVAHKLFRAQFKVRMVSTLQGFLTRGQFGIA